MKPLQTSGFSLVELMVAVAIIGILALIAAPLGRTWVAQANLENSENVLYEGYAFARSLALENRTGVTGNSDAAILSVTGSTVSVAFVDPADPTKSIISWQKSLNSDVNVTISAACSDGELALTNMGLPINSACLDYTLSIGGIDDLSISLQKSS